MFLLAALGAIFRLSPMRRSWQAQRKRPEQSRLNYRDFHSALIQMIEDGDQSRTSPRSVGMFRAPWDLWYQACASAMTYRWAQMCIASALEGDVAEALIVPQPQRSIVMRWNRITLPIASQVLYKHGYDLLGPDDVQTLLANLERTSPTLVENVVPKLVPLHTLTSILRHLLSDRIPISDMRRILEGVIELVTQNLSPQDTAEALRPALAPLLIQQVAPLNAPLPLITLAPELEQLLMKQNPNEPLVLEPQLAQTILGALSQVTEDMASSGRTALVVASAQLRRPFAAYLRAHSSRTIVLAINELPDNRPIEVVASMGGSAQITTEES